MLEARPGRRFGLAGARLDDTALACLLLGALGCLLLHALPPPWFLALTALSGLLLLALRGGRGLGWLALGAAIAGAHAQAYLADRLQADEAATYAMRIVVLGLPEQQAEVIRFDARVLDSGDAPARLRGSLLRLAWYTEDRSLHAGQVIDARLRLRAPRGLRNPGGFDAERHAAQRHLLASGIVESASMLTQAAAGTTGLLAAVDRQREAISVWIAQQADPAVAGFLQGLAVGDTRSLSDADWDILRVTGLSHLLAISGLHIGLVAGIGALAGRALCWSFPGIVLRVPRPHVAALGALLLAAPYCLLAGLSLPTVRTLAMLTVVALALLWRRRVRGFQILGLAAVGIVVFDPLAMLGVGFWLSFIGVAWLILCMPGSTPGPAPSSWRGWAHSLLLAQWVMTFGLLPLTVLFFAQASLVGPLLNLLAVPWVTLVTVPLTMAAVACAPWQWLGGALLDLAELSMRLIWSLASTAAQWPLSAVHLPAASGIAFLLGLVGALLLLAPRGMPGRVFGVLLLLPLLWPRVDTLPAGEFRLQTFDVGQGLAVLVQTRSHALLYDSGARFRHGGDMGDQVVVPGLRALGVDKLDVLLLSHADSDHAGGARSVLAAFADTPVLTAEPAKLADLDAASLGHCSGQSAWTWDGVRFELLHPPEHFPELGNDASCVLRVSAASGSALLPGDISSVIEQRLVREHSDLAADVLVVSHHGSRTGSDPGFVAAVKPEVAIVSAGFQNRFGHPHAEVLERLQAQGATVLATAELGMISWQPAPQQHAGWSSHRRQNRRWWHVD